MIRLPCQSTEDSYRRSVAMYCPQHHPQCSFSAWPRGNTGQRADVTVSCQYSIVTSACFYHIRRLKQICRLLGPDVATSLVSAFVLSRLDYCNSILAGLPKTTIASLQHAQNAAARLVARLGPRDHICNALRHLRDLHWHRITYKLCLLMYLVHNNRAPSYLVDTVTATASLSYRGRLQSASSQRYEQPRTRLKFGELCFDFAGPAAWNSLPSSVQELTDTTAFKHQLKL